MGSTDPAPTRRRNTVLQVLEVFRRLDPGVSAGQVAAFLYICENEGLCVSELAQVASMNMAAASRAARSLAVAGEAGALPPFLGLVRIVPQGRLRTLHLTPEARKLAERINTIIESRQIIETNQ